LYTQKENHNYLFYFTRWVQPLGESIVNYRCI